MTNTTSNPNYNEEAIANLSNFVEKYHTKIENLSILLDQEKSLTFPNIKGTTITSNTINAKKISLSTSLNTKGGDNNKYGGTHLPHSNGNNYISAPKNIIRGQLCINNTCINENNLKWLKKPNLNKLTNSKGTRVTLQNDDNLVQYCKKGNAVWANGKNGKC